MVTSSFDVPSSRAKAIFLRPQSWPLGFPLAPEISRLIIGGAFGPNFWGFTPQHPAFQSFGYLDRVSGRIGIWHGALPGLAGAAGLEPATSRFEGGDSIQLSYAPNADFRFAFGFGFTSRTWTDDVFIMKKEYAPAFFKSGARVGD